MRSKVSSPDTQKGAFDAPRFWRHYVATADTDDAAWQNEQEKGGHAGRIFMFLLLFHVFLIAAAVLFNMVAERPKPVFADSSPPKKPSTAANPKTREHMAKPPQILPATKGEDTSEVVVGQGDSLKTIADKAGATPEEIAQLNQISLTTVPPVGSKLLVPKGRTAAPAAPALPPARVQTVSVAMQAASGAKPGADESFQAVKPPGSAAMPLTPEPATPSKFAAVVDKLPEDKVTPKMTQADTPPKPKPAEAKVAAKPAEPTKSSPPRVEEPAKVGSTKPGSVERVTDKPAVAARPAPGASAATHTVKPKETFYSISRKYHVSVDELMKLNGFTDPGKLREGTSLKIPKAEGKRRD